MCDFHWMAQLQRLRMCVKSLLEAVVSTDPAKGLTRIMQQQARRRPPRGVQQGWDGQRLILVKIRSVQHVPPAGPRLNTYCFEQRDVSSAAHPANCLCGNSVTGVSARRTCTCCPIHSTTLYVWHLDLVAFPCWDKVYLLSVRTCTHTSNQVTQQQAARSSGASLTARTRRQPQVDFL